MRFAYYHTLLAVLFLFVSLPVSHAEVALPDDREVTIAGGIEKAAIDEKGEVIAVEIWVEQGEGYDYYLVNDTPKGNELLALVGKKVKATGILEEDEDGNKILTVKEFTEEK